MILQRIKGGVDYYSIIKTINSIAILSHILIMRHHDNGNIIPETNLTKALHKRMTVFCIKRTGWLVGQQQLWRVG